MLVNQIFMGGNATESSFNIRGCPKHFDILCDIELVQINVDFKPL